MKRVANVLTFYQSTLLINVAISVLPLLTGGLVAFGFVFCTFGFSTSIAVKELKQNQYLFYYNNGLTKLQLIAFSSLLNMACFAMLALIIYPFING